jgi:hypothetical protein
MSQNQALQNTQLNDILFSEEEILKNGANREQIFELKDEAGLSLGFVAYNIFKTYCAFNEEDSEKFSVRNIDSQDWTLVFEHPLFQRRKPQVIAEKPAIDNDQEFFILKQGQKTGPFKKEDLITMLDDKELLLTDMVSYNSGYTWMKLFQLENFERRVLKESEQLPGLPLEAINHNNEHVINLSPATEAISSLAYLSNVKRGKSIERDNIQNFQSDKVVKTTGMGMHKWLLIVSVIGTVYFLYHLSVELKSPFKEEASPIGEQAEVLTPVQMSNPGAPRNEGNIGTQGNQGRSQYGQSDRTNQINDQQRNGGKFNSRPMNPVLPRSKKSFMDSAQYQEINNPSNTAEDPNYFYDNTSAMELDPVRSQVSKENYDNQGSTGDGPIPTQDAVFENEVSN